MSSAGAPLKTIEVKDALPRFGRLHVDRQNPLPRQLHNLRFRNQYFRAIGFAEIDLAGQALTVLWTLLGDGAVLRRNTVIPYSDPQESRLLDSGAMEQSIGQLRGFKDRAAGRHGRCKYDAARLRMRDRERARYIVIAHAVQKT